MTNQELLKAKAIKEKDEKLLVDACYNIIKYNNKYCLQLLTGSNMKNAKQTTRYLSVSHLQEIVETVGAFPPLANGYRKYRESYAPGHFNLYLSPDNLDYMNHILSMAKEQSKLIGQAYREFLKDHEFDRLASTCDEILDISITDYIAQIESEME